MTIQVTTFFQFSVPARIERTQALGVEVHVMEGKNYDETVEAAHTAAADNGWTFIQDVTLDGYKAPGIAFEFGGLF